MMTIESRNEEKMSTTIEAKSPQAQATAPSVLRNLRRKKKSEGRKKRSLKLKTDKDFSKKYFEAKSKRSSDKKSSFRKKKNKKK